MRYRCALGIFLALAACADYQPRRPGGGPGEVGILGGTGSLLSSGRPSAHTTSRISIGEERKPLEAYIESGSGNYTATTSPRPVEIGTDGTTVSLNFVDVDLQEFVRVVFDEILKKTVVVDASLKGRITLRTSSPVSRSAALDLVREALQVHGASLVPSGDLFRVVSRSDQKSGRQIGGAIRIVPVKYIAADEARNALAPFSQSGIEISANSARHYLTISGPPGELDNLEQVVATLDVDQLKGKSIALIPLREAGAGSLSEELSEILGDGPDGRSLRVLPITRMNALLIIAAQPSMLDRARNWISRLDRAGGDSRRIYVYPVQNRRAQEIAEVLIGIIHGDETSSPAVRERPLAPDLTPVASIDANPVTSTNSNASTSSKLKVKPLARDSSERVRVSADTSTNSVVVNATPEEWKLVEAALRRLDLPAPQVLIEATIAEVRLNDALRHGVRWFFESGNHSVVLTNSETGSLASVFPGFNYVFGTPRARIVLNALEKITDVETVSSPALTVLDNQTAKLQVGDQVPIATRSSRSVISPDAPIVNDIEFKDTGVILSVTPRVNASGLVNLDITQEISDVVPTTTSNLDSPTIRQRRINSSVSVHSGTEIVLGGLIGTNRAKKNDGIPGLMSIPILGEIFKSEGVHEGLRTELLVILRPTVIGNQVDVRMIANEIKRRMSGASGAIYRR